MLKNGQTYWKYFLILIWNYFILNQFAGYVREIHTFLDCFCYVYDSEIQFLIITFPLSFYSFRFKFKNFPASHVGKLLKVHTIDLPTKWEQSYRKNLFIKVTTPISKRSCIWKMKRLSFFNSNHSRQIFILLKPFQIISCENIVYGYLVGVL